MRPDVTARANGQTSTVSDLFLELNDRMEEMEDTVGMMERKKRKVEAGRY
jgi:hypothetical protein